MFKTIAREKLKKEGAPAATRETAIWPRLNQSKSTKCQDPKGNVMRLVVKQNDRLVNQIQFIKGPIHLGRHAQCQVFLPSPSVSRQHAVVFLGEEGQWLVKDLQSTNKTHLNGKVVGEAPIETGDRIQIGDYVVEVDLENGGAVNKLAPLEDTHAPVSRGPQLIARTLDGKHAPAMRMPMQRANDLKHILGKVAQAGGGPETSKVLLRALISQFHAGRVWCSFRYDTDGIFEEQGGRTNTGQPFDLKSDALKKRIEEACANRKFLLLSRIDQQPSRERAPSVIIAPIIGGEGNLGSVYIESKPDRGPFSMSDLDYAMLLSIGLGIILENF
jgi:hypothetical protein